jgi:FAD/FMN-containing dehydrogenase
VKNVAGYDLCKLFTGSYGTLGVIVEINFKLRPLPFETSSIVATGRRDDVLACGREVIDSRLFPVAVELLSPSLAKEAELSDGTDHLMLLRFAGSQSALEHQTNTTIAVLRKQGQLDARLEPHDATLWQSLAALPLRFQEGLVYRAGVQPADVGSFLEVLDQTLPGDSMWQASVGDGRICVVERLPPGDNESQQLSGQLVKRLEELRAVAQALGGSLIIDHAPATMKSVLNAWGAFGSSADIMQRIKHQLDPVGILSPGRFSFENV